MNEEEIKLIDGFFNKGWCCDLDEVYNTVMKLQDLYNKEKERNIELATNIDCLMTDLKDLEQIEKEHKEENGRLREELEKKDKIIENIKFINNNNKPHIAQQKIREYFTNKAEEDIKE